MSLKHFLKKYDDYLKLADLLITLIGFVWIIWQLSALPEYNEHFDQTSQIYSSIVLQPDIRQTMSIQVPKSSAAVRALSDSAYAALLSAAKTLDYAPALLLYKRLVSVNNDPSVLTNYGLVLLQLSDTTNAIKRWQQALHAKAHYPVALNNYAVVQFARGDYRHAIKLLNEAISEDPKYSLAFYNLYLFQFALGNYAYAAKALDAAAKLEPRYGAVRDSFVSRIAESGR